MPKEIPFDALSRNEQYTSLCFIKFKFMDQTSLCFIKFKFMDQTIIFIQKATFPFRGPFLKTFHTLYPQKNYEKYVFKHLVTYVIMYLY